MKFTIEHSDFDDRYALSDGSAFRTEEELDEIAMGTRDRDKWLHEFYFGNGQELPGLKPLVQHNIDTIDAATLNAFHVGPHPETGDMIEARPGKFGPYIRCGEQTAIQKFLSTIPITR